MLLFVVVSCREHCRFLSKPSFTVLYTTNADVCWLEDLKVGLKNEFLTH